MAILIGLALPYLRGSRDAARRTVSQSNARECALAVTGYAQENKGLPPVIFAPKPLFVPPGPSEDVEIFGRVARGAWFNNGWQFHYAIWPPLPASVLREPDAPALYREDAGGVETSKVSDYAVAECLFADAIYWNRWTQKGPEQWRAQRLDSIVFPSSKGFVTQKLTYPPGADATGLQTFAIEGIYSSVVWADLSVSTEVQVRLLPGEPNFWYHGTASVPIWADGLAIDNTKHGVRGFDRGGREPSGFKRRTGMDTRK